MNTQIFRTVMVVLSILFGVTIALLAMLDSDAVGMAAAIGGVILGAMWAVFSFVARSRTTA